MREHKGFIKSYFIVLISGLVSLAFSPVNIQDIETAVLQDNYVEAESLARGFMQNTSGDPELHTAGYYLGLSLLFQGKHEQARAAFEQVIKARPGEILEYKSRIGIIDSFILAGEYETALKRAEQMLRAKPSEFSSRIYLKIARSNLKLTRWEDARKYLQKIVSDFPNSPEAHLAKQLLEEKQYFSVQVGSFLDRQRAENFSAELKQKGEYAFIVETVDKTGRDFYRVRIGQFFQLKEAQGMEKRLLGLGYPTLIYP